nr:sigma-70 family RNA polymerase sigma factor [Pedobacter panaciterrae]
MTLEQLSDKELWDSIVNDNSQAFAVLYNRHWKKLYKTSCHYLKDKDAAEQILHDAFVTLWTRRKFLKIENFNSYIYITTKYHVFKHLKAAKVSIVDYIEQYEEEATEVNYNEGEKRLDYKDFEIQLDKYLLGVPKRCKEIFWLSRVEHLSNEEIANQLGISKRTVENQITYALKHLRHSYKELSIAGLSLLFVTIF